MHINNEGIEPVDNFPWWTREKTKEYLLRLIVKETDPIQSYLIIRLYNCVDSAHESKGNAYFFNSILYYADLIANNPMEDTKC